jgi:hypothetical protein
LTRSQGTSAGRAPATGRLRLIGPAELTLAALEGEAGSDAVSDASLTGAVGIQCMGRKNAYADQGEDLNHCRTSRSPIVARKLLRDWFQIKSKMNCMSAVPIFLPTKYAALCFRMFSSAPENGFVRRLAGTQ